MRQLRQGKKIVNVPSIDCMSVGAGFPIGQLTMKDVSSSLWYIVEVSGSSPNVSIYVSSPLSIFGTSSYYDQNIGYQLVAGDDNNTYQVSLSASVVVVNPNMYATGSFIKSIEGAIIPTCKSGFLFQNVSDGNYYDANLQTVNSTMSLVVSQTIVSQSWVRSLY